MEDERGQMISPPKWQVLLVENQAACATCRPPSRVLTVVPCQSLGVPTRWQVCLPQGPIEAYTAASPSGQLILPHSTLCMQHVGTFHVV